MVESFYLTTRKLITMNDFNNHDIFNNQDIIAQLTARLIATTPVSLRLTGVPTESQLEQIQAKWTPQSVSQWTYEYISGADRLSSEEWEMLRQYFYRVPASFEQRCTLYCTVSETLLKRLYNEIEPIVNDKLLTAEERALAQFVFYRYDCMSLPPAPLDYI